LALPVVCDPDFKRNPALQTLPKIVILANEPSGEFWGEKDDQGKTG
jgi:hypothetical protein